jgi:hypothetical protein
MLLNVFVDQQYNAIFQEQGYLVMDLLTAKDIADLKSVFTTVEAQHTYDIVASVVLHDIEMRRFIHQNILPVFERNLLTVLNEYKFILGSFVAKRADSAYGKFPLHQDPTFVEEENHVGLSIWCPLVDVDEINGCLGILPGSHRLKNLYRAPTMLPYSELVDIIEARYMHYIPMKAGQVLFMNTRVIHGSPPNLSKTMRPVAAGVAIPAHLPLLCCHVDEEAIPAKTSVFHVPDDFYLRHTMTALPKEGTCFKTLSTQIEQLSPEKIEKQFTVLN